GTHDRIRHRPFLLESRDDPGNGRLLLANRDVNAVERTVRRITRGLGSLVHPGLVVHGVDADRRLAGRSGADDHLALSATDRDHRVDGHDAGLHRLTDFLALDD